MRKLLTSLVVTLGIAAIVRRLRRRGKPEPALDTSSPATAPPEPTGEDPAAELRRKLDETRTEDEAGSGSPEKPSAESSVEERRAEVYEQGRSALDDMQESSES